MRFVLLWGPTAVALITVMVLGVMIETVAAQQTTQPTPGRDAVTAPSTGAVPDANGAPQPAPGPQSAPAARAEYPNPLLVDIVQNLYGTDVRDRDDKKLGDVETALVNPDSKKVDRVVVDVGGVLGIGSRRVALPTNDLQWDSSVGVFRISTTEDELKSMPEWQEPTTIGTVDENLGNAGDGTPMIAPDTDETGNEPAPARQ